MQRSVHLLVPILLLLQINLLQEATIGIYRENAIAIESEARESQNVYIKADRRAFALKERNLHCGVHVTAENKPTLSPFGYLDSFWVMRLQRSRHRDKGLLSYAQTTRSRWLTLSDRKLIKLSY